MTVFVIFSYSQLSFFSFFFFYLYGTLRDLHSFPTRRSSDLLRRGEICSLHHGWLHPDARRHHLALQRHGHVRFGGISLWWRRCERRARVAELWRTGARAAHGDAALPGVLRRVCHQSAALPAAHLAAPRARGGSHSRLLDARCAAAETLYLRPDSLLPAS